MAAYDCWMAGMTAETISQTNEQAQFLQQTQWSDTRIAGQLFQTDPTTLGIQMPGSAS